MMQPHCLHVKLNPRTRSDGGRNDYGGIMNDTDLAELGPVDYVVGQLVGSGRNPDPRAGGREMETDEAMAREAA
jgi:hypothetical protein